MDEHTEMNNTIEVEFDVFLVRNSFLKGLFAKQFTVLSMVIVKLVEV